MSHMIYAERADGQVEFASVNTTSAARDLYKLLDATEFDAGCSGSGESKIVARKDIFNALLKAHDEGSKTFLAEVLLESDCDDDVKVIFA